MQQISLQRYPDYVAVIDGRYGLSAALQAAKEALFNPDCQCAVVVRASPTLVASHAQAVAAFRATGKAIHAYARLQDDRFVQVGMGRTLLAEFNRESLLESVGSDFAQFLTIVPDVFPGLRQMEMRAHDYQNVQPHLDFGRIAPAGLPGGVTVTMAVKGGGTVVTPLQRDQLLRAWHEDLEQVTWQLRSGLTIDPAQDWAVADGDICLMRSSEWPESHLPTLHRSPARSQQGQAAERVVAVFLP